MSCVPNTPFPWSDYYEAMRSKPLHPHYENLDPYLPHGGRALDIGCGVGQGVVHLAKKGFQVTAVDAESEALEVLAEWLPEGARVDMVQARFETFDLQPEAYDVVVAHFTLFFLKREEFDRFWPSLVGSVKPGGVFSFQLLGVNDTWVERGYTVHTHDEALKLLDPLEVLYFEEVDRDGETAQGTAKHWHLFHIVARKPESA